jgi:HD-GYP domain-containing protein (c-di-GMP phosphodiesterase class II)
MRIELDSGLLKSLLIFGAVIEARDAYTGGHTWRVAHFSRKLAEKAGLSDSEIFMASIGGFVHDLGKVGVPDSILNKPDQLTALEYDIIKAHPVIGKNILAEHPLAPLVLDAINHHHERIDGKGYPEGIPGEEHSIFSRIIAIADAFDAMTSTRPYRAGMPKEKAMAILQCERGLQFDASLVDCFVSLALSNELAQIIGHSDESVPLLNCPVCGPIIAVPRNKKDGDTIYCNSCKGKFELHIKGDTFEAEFKNEKLFTVQPEIDYEQIGELAERAPRHMK